MPQLNNLGAKHEKEAVVCRVDFHKPWQMSSMSRGQTADKTNNVTVP